jgi:hypothetical protein
MRGAIGFSSSCRSRRECQMALRKKKEQGEMLALLF